MHSLIHSLFQLPGCDRLSGGACSRDKILVLTADGLLWVWKIKGANDKDSDNNGGNHFSRINGSPNSGYGNSGYGGRLSSPTRFGGRMSPQLSPQLGAISPPNKPSRDSGRSGKVVELELKEDISHIRSVDFVGFKDSEGEGSLRFK
jgi:hypothetical protein